MSDHINDDLDPLESSMLLDAFEPVAPDDDVWTRIEAQISGPAPASDAVRVERKRTPWFTWNMGLAVAAVFVLVLGIAAIVSANQGEEATFALDTTRDLIDPATGEVVATVATGDRGQSMISNEGLAALGADETYQLWSVVGDEIVSVGLLGSDPDSVPLRLEGEPAVLALTVEVAGGVAVSVQDPVAVWQAPSS